MKRQPSVDNSLNIDNNYKKSTKRVSRQHNVLILLFICNFLFTDMIKEIIIQNIGSNFKIPFLSMIIIIYLLIFYRRNNWIFMLVICTFFLNILSSINYDYNFRTVLRFTSTILLPLVLISIKIYEPKILAEKIIRIMNSTVVVYVFLGVIDYLGNGFMRNILSGLLKSSYYNISILFDLRSDVYRWFSLFGHSLVNATYIILFLITNLIFLKVYKKVVNFNIYIIYLVAILGIVLSNSKFGLIIIALILIINIKNEKRKSIYISLIVIATIVLLNSTFFQVNVLARFEYAINSGDISNGRFTVFNELSYSGLYKLNLFLGRGMASSDSLVRMAFGNNSGLTNMEIPLLMFLYEYGIVSTIIIYQIMFVYPCYILIRNRMKSILLLVLLLFLFINSYNGIATGIGIMQLYAYIIMLYINICIYNEKDKIRRNHI